MWDLTVCRGCSCAEGVVSAKVMHALVKGTGATCKDWFTSTDQFVRAYMANVRAAVLIEKNMMCALSSKAPSAAVVSNKKISTTTVAAGFKVPDGFKDITGQYIGKLTGQSGKPNKNVKSGVCKKAMVYHSAFTDPIQHASSGGDVKWEFGPTGEWFQKPSGKVTIGTKGRFGDFEKELTRKEGSPWGKYEYPNQGGRRRRCTMTEQKTNKVGPGLHKDALKFFQRGDHLRIITSILCTFHGSSHYFQ